jgi:peptide/nickel transport system ATP-binding protein
MTDHAVSTHESDEQRVSSDRMEPLLSVRNLEKQYPITEGLLRRTVGQVRAVDGVSFELYPGETFGIVGESGCGKSTTALTLLGLEEPTDGTVEFDGKDVTDLGNGERREFRRRVQLVLQDPETAFNPRMTIRETVAEPLEIHGLTDTGRCRRLVEDALEHVGLGEHDPDTYPHEFSGGEKQRIAIARALVLDPDVIIADEPVSALDGRTKTAVLDLFADLQDQFDLSLCFISHDIDVVERICDRVGVMYLGEFVEVGPTDAVIDRPHHPYTRTLLSAVPSLNPGAVGDDTALVLTDELPDAKNPPDGCRFHPRCQSIIPSTETEMAPDDWRGVVACRLTLEQEWEDATSFRQSLADGETLTDQLRSTFDIPTDIDDPDVERAFDAALTEIEGDNLDGAATELEAVTGTVCEQACPTLSSAHSSHAVACHRYDPDEPGAPLVEE